MTVEIKNNMAYVKENNKIVSYITFPIVKENIVNINRTFTSTDKRGQGLAKVVMDGLYEHLKENNLKAIPSCSYAVVYFEKYQEKRDVLYQKQV